MGSSGLLSMRFALVLSLSFAAIHSSSSSCKLHSSPKPQKATASDLLSLLATPQQASTLNPNISSHLLSSLKFLVPFTPPRLVSEFDPPLRKLSPRTTQRDANELVWCPPQPVLELARLAFDSGGDPGVIYRSLDPTIIPIPDVEGSKRNKCQLTRTTYGWHFINEEINAYFQFLFKLIAAKGPSVGLNVSLDRFDLFHGHLFLAENTKRMGILFHAKEYPAFQENTFPYNMGYCQKGSTVIYDDSMNLRNILWLAPLPSSSSEAWMTPGVLVVLDAHPGGIIYRDLIPDYVKYARTLYEEDFGDVVVDVNYLNVGATESDYQIYIC